MDALWTTSQVIVIGVAAGAGGVVAGVGFTLHWVATTPFGRSGAAALQWPAVPHDGGPKDGGASCR